VNPLILALDTDDVDVACKWIEATNESIATYKVGLEFFLTYGTSGVAALRNAGDFQLFLDLKLHDIPNTVRKATLAVADIEPTFLTVHASGGFEMVSAATSAAPNVFITAVTILTSLSSENVRDIGYAKLRLNRQLIWPPLQLTLALAPSSHRLLK